MQDECSVLGIATSLALRSWYIPMRKVATSLYGSNSPYKVAFHIRKCCALSKKNSDGKGGEEGMGEGEGGERGGGERERGLGEEREGRKGEEWGEGGRKGGERGKRGERKEGRGRQEGGGREGTWCSLNQGPWVPFPVMSGFALSSCLPQTIASMSIETVT